MEIKPEIETFAKIKVVGIGGGGGAAINRMVNVGISGIEFLAVNTDAQALHHSEADNKIHIGKNTTRGLGAGMDPDLGRKSAEENLDEIHDHLKGSDMVFITCGLGGGTGTGAAPVIADVARDVGSLTVAIITKPFTFEGEQRRAIAESGYRELADRVDAIITIPNDRLLQIIDKKTTLLEAFTVADDILRQGVQGISNLITVPGLINVDFADVKAIMANTGSALMGIGHGTGENRSIDAAKSAIDSPLLDLSINGARGILFTITGGPDLGMYEVNEAAKIITESADPNARVIFGAIIDDAMKDDVSITVVATGFDADKGGRPVRTPHREETRRTVHPEPRPLLVDDTRPAPESSFAPKGFSLNEEPVMPASPRESRPRTIDTPKTSRDENDEDLEIPAFIRKKMM
ncbi:MAG: cell division protein FtsZ [Candidatus Kerfeldbacteria bacterium]|nr:cell division protein FtsZ [Candidatus Kerfeldbacteria bacterium]